MAQSFQRPRALGKYLVQPFMLTRPVSLARRATVIAGKRYEDDFTMIWRGLPIGRIMQASACRRILRSGRGIVPCAASPVGVLTATALSLMTARPTSALAFVNPAFAEPLGSGALPNRYKSMSTLLKVIGIWFALNLAIPAFIIYQRSPRLRHRLFRLTLGGFTMPRERELAHGLVEAAYHHH